MAEEILGQGRFNVSLGDKGVAPAIKMLVGEMGKLASATNVASKAVVNLNKGTVQLSTGMASSSQATDRAAQSTSAFSSEAFRTSLALGAVSTSLIALNKSLGSVAYGFDRNMTLVKAVTGATGEEFKQLSGLARQLGAETEFGATKAADGLLVLSRMGLTAAESMRVLEPAMKLAQAQQYDMTATTELVVQQLRVFGKETTEAASFANVLAATSSRSAADLEKLGTSLSYVGPVAAATGRSFEEVNATLGLMFNAGIRASRAGTSLRFAFAALLGTTSKTKKALKELGLTLEDIDPTTKTMDQIFRTLADSLKGVQNRAGILFDLFGKRAAPAMSAVVEQVIRNRDAFSDMQAKITGTGEVTRQYEEQMRSFSGIMLKIRSNIQELVLGFTDGLVPAIRYVGTGVLDLIKWFQGIPDSIKGFISAVTVAGTVLTTLIASIAAFRFTAGILGGSLSSLTAGFSNMGKSVVGLVSPFYALTNAEARYNIILRKGIAASVEKSIVNQKLSQQEARRIIQISLAAASTKKLQVEKLAAFRATLQQQLATTNLTKAQQRQIMSTLTLRNAQLANNKELGTAIAKMYAMNTAGSALSATMKGLWAAIGGWAGVAIIGITSLMSWMLKLKAEEEEQNRRYQEMQQNVSDVYDTLQKAAKTQNRIQLEIGVAEDKGELEEVTRLVEESNEKYEEMQKAKLKIIELNPALLEGYDAENGYIELNIQLLQELLPEKAKEIELMQQSREERVKNLKSLIAYHEAEFELNRELVDEFERRVEAQKKMAQQEATDDFAAFATYTGSTAAQGLEEYQKDLKDLQDTQAEHVKNIEKYKNMLKELEEQTKKNGPSIDGLGDSLVGTGDDADKLANKIANLIEKLDKMIAKYKELNEELQLDITSTGVGAMAEKWYALDKAMAKARRDFSVTMIDMQADLDKAVRGGYATTEIVSKFKEATKLLEENFDGQKELIKAKSAELIREQLNNMKTLSDETTKILVKSNNRAWDDVEGRMEDATKETDAEVSKQIRALKELQRQYAELAKVAMIQEQPAVASAAVSAAEDVQDQIEAIELRGAQDIADAKLQILEKYHNTELRLFTLKEKFKIREMKKFVDQKKQEYEFIKNQEDASLETIKLKYVEMKEAQREYSDYVIDTMHKATKSALNSLKRISVALSNQKDDWAEMFDYLNAFSDVIAGVASQNYVQAVAGLLEFVAALVENTQAEREIYEKAREQEQDLLKKQLVELQKMNKNFAELFREVLGLGTSTEDLVDLQYDFYDKAANTLEVAFAAGVSKVADRKYVPWLKEGGGQALFEYITGPLRQLADEMGLTNQLLYGTAEEQVKAYDLMESWIPVLNSIARGTISPSSIDFGGAKSEVSGEQMQTYMSLVEAGWLKITKNTADWIEFAITDSAADFAREVFGGQDTRDFLDSMIGGNGIPEAIAGDISTLMKASDALEAARALREEIPKQIADGIDDAELLTILEDLKDTFDEFAGQDIGGFNIIGAEDYRTLADQLLTRRLAIAGGEEAGIRDAFSKYSSDLENILNIFSDQLSTQEMIDIGEELSGIPARIQEEIAKGASGAADATRDAAEAFKNSANSLVEAFENGEKSFVDTLNGLNNLRATIQDMPVELRDELTKFINEAISKLIEEKDAAKEKATGLLGDVSSETQDFRDDIQGLNEDMEEVVENWQDLLDERSNLIQSFEEDAAKIKSDSDERIKTLEAEREAILGVFDFGETQNQRSNRFAEAREKERDILLEMASVEDKLQDLQARHEEALARIDGKLQDLTDKYGSIDGVYSSFAAKRAAREAEYVGYLQQQSMLLSEILNKSIDLNELYSSGTAWEGYGSPGAMVAAGEAGTFTPQSEISGSMAVLTAGIAQLTTAIATAFPEVRTAIGEAVAGPNPITPTFNTGPNQMTMEDWVNGIQSLFEQNKEPWSLRDSLSSLFKAQHGFQGMVKEPTGFVAGEYNRPEMVSITPVSDLAKMANGVAGGGVTNVYINENLDFRGAYGITDRSVAEEVYRNVWAPARRRNLDRFLNTSGRVIR